MTKMARVIMTTSSCQRQSLGAMMTDDKFIVPPSPSVTAHPHIEQLTLPCDKWLLFTLSDGAPIFRSVGEGVTRDNTVSRLVRSEVRAYFICFLSSRSVQGRGDQGRVSPVINYISSGSRCYKQFIPLFCLLL